MNYHLVVKKIKEILENNNAWYESIIHPPVTTSYEASKVRKGFNLSQGAKALIVKIKEREKSESRFVMLVMPGDLKFDNKRVKDELGIKEFRFASEEEVAALTNGVKIGGVPPFGNLFNLDVYVDEKLFSHEKIVFNAGDRGYSIAMKSEDFKTIVSPKIVSIT